MEYGTSRDSLDMTSDPTHSGEDITIANVTYSVTLSDLRENTTYYVHIVATNTAGRSNTSSVERFMTLFMTSLAESGTFIFIIFLQYPMHEVEFATHMAMLTDIGTVEQTLPTNMTYILRYWWPLTLKSVECKQHVYCYIPFLNKVGLSSWLYPLCVGLVGYG